MDNSPASEKLDLIKSDNLNKKDTLCPFYFILLIFYVFNKKYFLLTSLIFKED